MVKVKPGRSRVNVPQLIAEIETLRKKIASLQKQKNIPLSQQFAKAAPAVGAELGSYFGPLGKAVGGGLGGLVNKIWGSGKYKVNSNTLASGQQMPVFVSKEREVIIAHREYVADITGTTSFNLAAYAINPGLSVPFPWLSQVAANFEQYEMLGLVYEFRTLSGTAVGSTNTMLGAVVMATDYDVNNPLFTSKQQMDSYEFSCSDVPYNSFMHPIECAPRDKTIGLQYVRSGPVPAGSDQRFYDLGNFQIATQGMQSGASTVGELWVSYHVRLCKPRIPPAGSVMQYAHLYATPSGTAAAASLGGTTGLLESYASSTPYNIVTFTQSTSNANFYLPTTGNYLILVGAAASSNIAAVPTVSFGANISNLTLFDGWAAESLGYYTGSSTAKCFGAQVTISGTGSANLVTLGGCTGLASGNLDIFVFVMPQTTYTNI